jgi:hypothetical protein
MATLKYWDMGTGTWLPLTGNPIVPTYRPVSYLSKVDTTINVTSTAYGVSTGPSLACDISGFTAAVFFYAQVGLAVGGSVSSDLVVSFSAFPNTGAGSPIAASDDNSLYLAPPPHGDYFTEPYLGGPGSISGVMFASSLLPGNWTFLIHQRVSSGTTSMLRRRMVVIPQNLVVSP